MRSARRCLMLAVVVLGTLLASPLFAAVGGGPTHVQASLVSADASVQPKHAFPVALRFVHDAHWHTYWKNPGTGLPTSITWKLPPGWTASDIQWPAPLILKDHSGAVIGNGYEGELFLPVFLTPPADVKPGEKVDLKASVEWLMCDEVCVPGNADLTLTLTASADDPKSDPAWHDKIWSTLSALPKDDPAWKVTASRDARTVTLHIAPATDAAKAHPPRDLHFFSDDNLAAYDQPQVVKSDGQGGFVLTAPVSDDGPKDATKLLGVLTSENGWRPDGSLRGLRIDASLAFATMTGPNTTSVTVLVAPTAPTKAGGAGTLLLALVGGLILNLMPCVFPVLGIKILGFVNQAGHDRRRVAMHGLVFTLGVLLSFWTLAGALAALRAGGEQLGWGFQLQSPVFVYALAVLLLVFGMNMSGVFEFGLSATAVGGDLQSKSGYAGSFFTGVLATVVATPCSAPFLAPALGAALAVSTIESFGIFTAIAVGLSTPYLLLSIFPQAVKVLPRPGAWMETFKQFMAFPLYATVGYLVWVLAGQVNEDGLQNILFSLVLVALGVWLYGRWHAPGASAGRARLGVAALLLVGATGLWLGWPHSATAVAADPSAPDVVWEPWSADAVAKLRAENRIVYVDFTARWCATCQANKKLVFHNSDVLKYFAGKKIATLRGDWTNKDPRITAELARYNRSAVPFNLIWMPGHDEPIVLPELLTPGTVLTALKSAGTDSAAAGGERPKSLGLSAGS